MSPKDDSTKLMNAVAPFAKKMLAEQGEFRPFGGYMLADGRIVDVGLDLEKQPSAADAVSILQSRFKEMAGRGEAIAFAVVYMVNIKCPDGIRSDAIQVNLDHGQGYSAEVLYPYVIQNGAVVYGKMFAQAGESAMFKQGRC